MISPSMLVRSRTVADPRWSPSGARLGWIDSYDGRSDVVVAPADGSGPPIVVTGECGAGGGWAWVSDDEFVVGAANGRLMLVRADGGVIRELTRDGRAFSPSVSVRGEVACSIERDDACDVATVPLDGSAWPVRVSTASYAWDPAFSPDGTELAWHEWDLPSMSWDASRIVVRDENGKTRVVADAPGCGQPRWSVDGRLAYICDNLLHVDGAPVLTEPFEHAEPAWGPGARSFAWSPDGSELVWCRNEDGFGRLVIGAVGRKSARELSKGWHRGIAWGDDGILCVRSGGVTPSQVVVLAPNGSARRTVARGPVGGFEHTGLIEGRAITWRAGNTTLHGIVWRPAVGAPNRSKGLIVSVHGGPTSQALVDWNPRIQMWVQQGYTVLQPNYRGSTGYGVAYRKALDGRWGDRDTADVAAGVKHGLKEGWDGGAGAILIGGSAGGLTVLNVAAENPDLIAAVVALYPVTDLLALDATTHRFESGYTATLVGALPGARATYVANSAITRAAKVRAPVLLLHGTNDTSVVPSQSAELEDALRRAGTIVERHLYEGEGHGWRRAATVGDELERIASFLKRHVG